MRHSLLTQFRRPLSGRREPGLSAFDGSRPRAWFLNLQRVLMRKSFFTRALAALMILLIGGACGGNGGAPTATPTKLPETTVTPTPERSVQSEDLALAERLYAEGAVEEATAIYARVIVLGGDNQRQDALWGLARLQYQEGDSDAKDTVDKVKYKLTGDD